MILLEKSGAMEILALTDSDDSGIKAREKIRSRCSRMYNVKFLDLPSKDIGEMSIEEVRKLLCSKKY